MSRVLLLA